jgi:hypothetical protein
MAPVVPGLLELHGLQHTGGSFSGCGHYNAKASADLRSPTDWLFTCDRGVEWAIAAHWGERTTMSALPRSNR